MVLVKNLRFILLFVYGKIRPKKMLCDLLDKKTSLSSLSRPYKNIDLRKSQNFLFFKGGKSIVLVKNLKCLLLFFLDKKDLEKVCCSRNLLRKQDAVGASIKMLTAGGGEGLRFCVCSGSFEKSVSSRERA